MPKFKIKGTITEELPEVEIEAKDREEAEEKYQTLYEKGKIEGNSFEFEFEEGDKEELEGMSLAERYDISNEGWDEIPRIVKGKNGEEFCQDILNITPLKNCKIYNLKEADYPETIWGSIEYQKFYQQKGYIMLQGGTNSPEILYKKIRYCVDCKKELSDYDVEKVLEKNRCFECQKPIWAKQNRELKEKAEKKAEELSKNKEFMDLKNMAVKRVWIEENFPELKTRSKMIVTRAIALSKISKEI